MGVLFNRGTGSRQQRFWGISSPLDMVPIRSAMNFGRGVPAVSNDTAMQNSAVWAAIRLRADLISTMPLNAKRNVTMPNGQVMQIDTNLTPFLASPQIMEWIYSSQVELDRSGNSIGIITAKTADNYPAAIELQPSANCSLQYRDGKLFKYRIGTTLYDPADIWHEKQYTVPGLDVGLSPVAYAAFTLGTYKSVQEFASDWFVGGATPRARLKNVAKKLSGKEATIVKEAWRAAQASGEPFVHGSDWDYALIQGEQNATNWIEAQKLSLEDIARFFNAPADLLDAAMSGGNITYANVTQRNLQFLIMHLGPAIIRRENALSQLLPRPRFVTMDTSAILRMDPMTLATMIKTKVEARVLAPSEARAMDNRSPYTEEQIREFDQLGLNRHGTTPYTSLAPVPVLGAVDVVSDTPVYGDNTISGETPSTGDNSGNDNGES